MASFDWRSTGDHKPERLAEARTQLISAAQWLARIERSYAARGNDKPLSLKWSDDRNAIVTGGFGDDLRLELRIDGLVMQFTENGRPSDHEIDTDERSPAHVEAWILIELLHRGVDRERFSKELPYDVSALFNGDAVEFAPSQYAAELSALAAMFAGAVEIVRQASTEPEGVRICPGDLAVEGRSGDRIVGFSLGDEREAEPHFYTGDGASTDLAGAVSILKVSDVDPHRACERFLAFLRTGAVQTRH